MEEDHRSYDDSNRAFLQAFLARGSLTLEQAKPILAGIFTVLGSGVFHATMNPLSSPLKSSPRMELILS
jgi:hypothetical protein